MGNFRKWEILEWEGNGIFSFFLPLEGGVECYLANLNSNKGCWRLANANK